jgi:asparagine synthase (glutamine-hydrolysing)
MCGIAGLITPDRDELRAALEAMDRAQQHRGPDDHGTSILPFGDRWLGLNHRRLSILDLSPSGHQPMIHPDTGDHLIFNGEIYNFALLRHELVSAGERLRSSGDTEVLLRMLTRDGEEALPRLEGMFAFAFYRAADQSLLLARDSLGIKPLYMAESEDRLVFASEVNGILASGVVRPDVDPRALAGLLAYGAVQHPMTMIRGVQSLHPGSSRTIRPGPRRHSSPTRRFWSFPPPTDQRTPEELIPLVRQTVETAVADHLVADVPVGVFLSSGLDSSVVAAVAARRAPDLRTFTVVFADEPDLSEGPLARATAQRLGLRHTEIEVTGAESQQAAMDWLGRLDQPSVDGLNVFLISRAVRSAGVTVALSGQGGDELFGGYPSFRDVPRLMRMLRTVTILPRKLRAMLAGVTTIGKPRAYREKLHDILRSDGSLLSLCLQRRRAMSDAQMAALGLSARTVGLTETFQAPGTLDEIDLPDDPISAISVIESFFYQGNMLLRDGDANGMAHGLEIRVPLLDQRLARLMYSIPGRTRLPDNAESKFLLRRAFPDDLPDSILQQSKRGFTLPIRRWMRGPLREVCEESLRSLCNSGLVAEAGVRSIWQAFLENPESAIWTRAFTLCVAGHWIAALPRRSTRPQVLAA